MADFRVEVCENPCSANGWGRVDQFVGKLFETKTEEEGAMNDHSSGEIPFMQRLLDSPFILLALGVLVPTLLYTVWGVVEVLAIPAAS